MKKIFILSAVVAIVAVFSIPVFAVDVGNVKIGGVWYLSYQNGQNKGGVDGEDFNKFTVKRGYINFKTEFTEWFSARVTPDVHQDDTGDFKVRMKYIYGKFHLPDFVFLTKPDVEWGLVHIPWLDFEEHINYYRLQDTMFIERNGTFNSADVGLTFFSLLGGEVSKEYQKKVSKKYPGRYGSFAVGVYNGGGYHAEENNENKAVEGRLTIRPLPDSFPGLQISYFGIAGKGNTADEPDFTVNMGYFSYESEIFVLASTYYDGEGNQKGTAIDSGGESLERDGYSVFGELKIPNSEFALMGRYDFFDPDDNTDDDENTRYIVGVARKILGHHKVLLDYDQVSYEDESKENESRVQLTLEVHF